MTEFFLRRGRGLVYYVLVPKLKLAQHGLEYGSVLCFPRLLPTSSIVEQTHSSTTKRPRTLVAPSHLLKNEQFKIILSEYAYILAAHIPQKRTTSFQI